MALSIGYGNSFVWVDSNNNETSIDVNNLCSINEFLRNYEYDPYFWTTCGSEFIGLLNVHSAYIDCPNLGHYNMVGVRGEKTIIKKVLLSSCFGYLILDSVVAPHDKLDVSRQSLKTMHSSLKNVHGNVIDLHGSHVSFSLIFQTWE